MLNYCLLFILFIATDIHVKLQIREKNMLLGKRKAQEIDK